MRAPLALILLWLIIAASIALAVVTLWQGWTTNLDIPSEVRP